jgi:hypothetical protein
MTLRVRIYQFTFVNERNCSEIKQKRDKFAFFLPIPVHVVIFTPDSHDFISENLKDFWAIPRQI